MKAGLLAIDRPGCGLGYRNASLPARRCKRRKGEATEFARWQVCSGAHTIDVCLQSSGRDELKDILPFYEKLIRKIKAPIMIDTTDPRSIELSPTYCQGKKHHQLGKPGGRQREV